jgi:hypothetical protein
MHCAHDPVKLVWMMFYEMKSDLEQIEDRAHEVSARRPPPQRLRFGLGLCRFRQARQGRFS